MRVARANRRLLRWYRYIQATHSMSNGRLMGGYHHGHMKAYSNVMEANRWAPKGIRTPWAPTTEPGVPRHVSA